MTREETPRPADLLLPEFTPNGVAWVQNDSMGELRRKLREGDPVRGWEGDPRLELYFHRDQDQWSLLRCEVNGDQALVARCRPGVAPDERLLDELLARDVRRGYDVHAAVVAHNETLEAARDQANVDAMVEEGAPRLKHALKRDGVIV